MRSFADHFSFFSFHLRTIAIEKLKNSIVINNKGELLFPEKEFGRKSEARNRLLVDLLARALNVTRRTIIRDLEKMKNSGQIKRIGPAKGGHWEVIK